MATSKYGRGKYSFRLYSAIPFRDLVVSASVNVYANGFLIKESPLSGYAGISIDASGYLRDAFVINLQGLAVIDVSSEGFLKIERPMAALKAVIQIDASGNPYMGPFWNEKICTPDAWSVVPLPTPAWGPVNCDGGSWSEVKNG